MSLLLPQTRTGLVRHVQAVDIHGDRYVDLQILLEDPNGADEGSPVPATGRVPSSECPGDLQPGDRVSVRFVVGVMTRVERSGAG